MEYVEEEYRNRILFQSHRPISVSNSQTLNRPTKRHCIISFSISILLLYLSFCSTFSHSQTLTFFLVWTSLSLLLSPFAPSSLTGGDPRVGLGHPLPPPPPPSDAEETLPTRRIRSRNRSDAVNPPTIPTRSQDPIRNEPPRSEPKAEEEEEEEEESNEWTDDDLEILKKQISKHPIGAPKRWEKIAQAFNGRHSLESVIQMGKSMGERRPVDKDSFARFLKQRKPLDTRVAEINDNGGEEEVNGAKEKCWSSTEDLALLNALKVFPKDVSMRWEKVAAAMPGRSKGECVKRVSELKRDFRSSKAS